METEARRRWQTRQDILLPANAEPWVTNLRLWVFEMNQWAEVVHDELHELGDEVESLKSQLGIRAGRQPAPGVRCYVQPLRTL